MVVLDSRKKRDGACLENLGTLNGLKGEFITFNPERFDAWVAEGAQPSATAKRLYRQYKQRFNKVAQQGVTEPRQKEQKKSQPATDEIKAQ